MTDEIEDMFDDLSNQGVQQDEYDEGYEDVDGYWDEPVAVHQRHTCRSCFHYGTDGRQAFCDAKDDEIYDICDTCDAWSPRY